MSPSTPSPVLGIYRKCTRKAQGFRNLSEQSYIKSPSTPSPCAGSLSLSLSLYIYIYCKAQGFRNLRELSYIPVLSPSKSMPYAGFIYYKARGFSNLSEYGFRNLSSGLPNKNNTLTVCIVRFGVPDLTLYVCLFFSACQFSRSTG